MLSVASDLQFALVSDEIEVRNLLELDFGVGVVDLTRIGDGGGVVPNNIQLDTDLSLLLGLGYARSHGTALFEDQGLAFVRLAALPPGAPTMQLGTPDLLLYKPTQQSPPSSGDR